MAVNWLSNDKGSSLVREDNVGSKRNYKDGSVYERSDGRWVASVRIDGKRISRYASTEIEAFKKLEKLLKDAGEQLVTRPQDEGGGAVGYADWGSG